MKTCPDMSRRSGFTLLELVVAIGLMSIIIGMVFGIARTSLALGNRIVETQNEEMLHQAFIELLGQRFAALPGNARFDLQVQDSGSHYLSDLTLQNVPLSFTWGGDERIAKAVQLSTVKRRSGYLDVVLRYYENEILEGSEATPGTSSSLSEKPFAEIVLLTDVAFLEWRVLDGRSMEWQFDWEIQGRMPLQVELTMAVGSQGEEIRQVFWLPAKQNPEVVMRQIIQQAANPGTGAGGDPQVGPDGKPITIPSPGSGAGSGVPGVGNVTVKPPGGGGR